MRSAALFVMLGIAVGVNGCGSSSNGGTGGAGGAADKGGSGGSAGVSGGTGGSAGASGAGGTDGGAGTAGGAGTTGSGGTGGAVAACGDATGAGSGETCNSVTPMGPCVTETFSTATPPSPTGGTLLAGTYNLTAQTAYVAADAAVAIGQIGRQTFVLSSGTSTASPALTLTEAESSGTAIARSSGPVAITGMNATFTPTCPVTDGGNQGGTDQFTATSSGFTLFEKKDNGATVVSVFAKAP
jgi:hypothetical protein